MASSVVKFNKNNISNIKADSIVRFNKEIPNSIEAEKSVISSMIQNNDTIDLAVDVLVPDMFYDATYKFMFNCIIELRDENVRADVVTVRNKILEKGGDEAKYSIDFFKDIIQSVPISLNIKEYCDIVRDKYLRRRAIETCIDITTESLASEKSPNEIINNAQGYFFDLSKNKSATDFSTLDEILPNILENVNAAANIKGGITGVRTGYRSIDEITAGLQKTNLIVIGARPRTGKTAFALNIAYNVSVQYKKYVAFFSLEMSKYELAQRLIAMETKIPGNDMRKGRLNEKDWADLIDGAGRLSMDKNLLIYDSSYCTISEMRNKCLKLKSDNKLDIIIIDYLQLMMTGTDLGNGMKAVKQYNNRQEEVAQISRSLKALAKELDVPVIALAQAGRSAEERKRPQLSDLRESGSIEQDADIVIFLHNEGINNPEAEDKSITEIIFAKHRNGPTDTINLKFDPSTTKYYEITNEKFDK